MYNRIAKIAQNENYPKITLYMTVKFNNPPQMYEGYLRDWKESLQKKQAAPLEIAIVEDLAVLVKIALSQLTPAKPEEKPN